MKKSTAMAKCLGLFFTRRSDMLKEMLKLTKELWSKNEVIKKYGLNKGLPAVGLLDLYPDFNENVKSYSYLDGTSKAIDIAFLKHVLKSKNNPSYLEFGSWRGESLLNLHEHTGECYSITLSKEMMRDFGYNEEAVNAVDHFTSDLKNIKRIYHNSQTYDFKDLYGKFDVVFVDADHEYPGVKIDTTNAFKLLKDENSILIWHDYGRTYESINWQVFHGIMDGMPKEEHKHIYKVNNTLCAIYTKQKLNAGYKTQYIPERTFSVNIKGD